MLLIEPHYLPSRTASSVQQTRLGRVRLSGDAPGEYGQGFARGEVVARPSYVFGIYVRYSFGEPAYLTVRGPADEDAPAERHPIYFMAFWHA